MLRVQFRFSVISNVRNPVSRPINGRVQMYDWYIDRYQNPLITAYTRKRRMHKLEVYPKIHILDHSIPEIQRELHTQALSCHTESLPLEVMASMYELSQITTPYILSKFNEKHLKLLISSYVSKVLVSGRMPPINRLKEYRDKEEEVIRLYRVFFFGEELSRVDQLAEAEYLTTKQQKFNDYNKSFQKSNRNRNQYLKCVFNEENQRCLERYANWQSRPFDDYPDFRPFFNPVLIPTTQEWSLLNTLRGTNEAIESSNVDFVSIQLFNRVLDWCNSLEFTRILKIPTDYLVELTLVNLHVWMIVSRLQKEPKVAENKELIQSLKSNLKELVHQKLGQISVETNSLYYIQVTKLLLLHQEAFEDHFNGNGSPRDGIDGLVWSTILLSKTKRNSDTVYLLSEYLLANYNMINRLSVADVSNGNAEFDVYLVDPDYRSKYQESLAAYPFKQSHRKITQPLTKPTLQLQNKSLSSKIYRIMRMMTYGLKQYDYYSEVEKQEKEEKQRQKIGWDQQDDINKEFTTIDRISVNKK